MQRGAFAGTITRMPPRNHRPTRPQPRHHGEDDRGTDAALTVDDIVRATLVVAHKVGFARLSMRQIAAQLGVTATALYHHFRGKVGLLDKVSGHIMDSIPMPDTRLPWRQRLREVVLAQQQTMLAYPGLASFLVHHRDCAGALRWIEMLLEVLHDAGFRGRHTANALATLSFFVHPLTQLEDRPRSGRALMMSQAGIERRVRSRAQRYPRLGEMLPQLSGFSFDYYLPIALDRLIAGLATELEETSARPAARRRRT